MAAADELQVGRGAGVGIGRGVECRQLGAHRGLVAARHLVDEVVVAEVEDGRNAVTDDVEVRRQPGQQPGPGQALLAGAGRGHDRGGTSLPTRWRRLRASSTSERMTRSRPAGAAIARATVSTRCRPRALNSPPAYAWLSSSAARPSRRTVARKSRVSISPL